LTVDAVIANLPFGQANWGHEELGYVSRWELGVPPRTEPELAWVQHAYAHLKVDGIAVLLMPPSAAGRRAGRRIRAGLLRRGALRTIIALPPGAAAPHGIGLHLWIPQRTREAPNILLVDATAGPVADAYQKIVEAVESGGEAGRSVSVIDLLDEEVDLTPAGTGRPRPTASMPRPLWWKAGSGWPASSVACRRYSPPSPPQLSRSGRSPPCPSPTWPAPDSCSCLAPSAPAPTRPGIPS
jgi:hypothetical protein